MTDKQLKKLKVDATDTLGSIDMSKTLTANEFVTVGACLAISGYAEYSDSPKLVIHNNVENIIMDINMVMEYAEKWLSKYKMANDKEFVQMAYDLTTHANKLIGIADQDGINTSNEVARLQILSNEVLKL